MKLNSTLLIPYVLNYIYNTIAIFLPSLKTRAMAPFLTAQETRRNISKSWVDASLHDVIPMHDVFFEPRFVIGILEMTGDHDRLLMMRIATAPAPAAEPDADCYQEEETHDDSHGDEQDCDPGTAVGEITGKLIMKRCLLLLAETQTISEISLSIGFFDQGLEKIHLPTVVFSRKLARDLQGVPVCGADQRYPRRSEREGDFNEMFLQLQSTDRVQLHDGTLGEDPGISSAIQTGPMGCERYWGIDCEGVLWSLHDHFLFGLHVHFAK